MFTVVPFRIPAVPMSAAPTPPTRRSRDTTAASRITYLIGYPPSQGAPSSCSRHITVTPVRQKKWSDEFPDIRKRCVLRDPDSALGVVQPAGGAELIQFVDPRPVLVPGLVQPPCRVPGLLDSLRRRVGYEAV